MWEAVTRAAGCGCVGEWGAVPRVQEQKLGAGIAEQGWGRGVLAAPVVESSECEFVGIGPHHPAPQRSRTGESAKPRAAPLRSDHGQPGSPFPTHAETRMLPQTPADATERREMQAGSSSLPCSWGT